MHGARDSASQAAIARASDATGVDFRYLLAQARIESSLDPSARAATSSAAGLYQFTDATWLETLARHAGSHGMDWVSRTIAGGGLADPAMRASVMGLRYDAGASAQMAAELARDNRGELSAALGREPDAAELYLAHFLGAAGATKFLTALSQDPSQSAALVLPRAAAANRAIFYEGVQARSLGAVMELLRGKVETAMAAGEGVFVGNSGLAGIAPSPSLGPLAREFHGARAASSHRAVQGLPEAGDAARPSMAETLRTTFGASDDALPGGVREAYARLARFGL
ncbi:lytic transglycosylase domain-containing protein [Novosphingobium sp. YJ-S2-02]|uniref:Lytic transglycosylase domain-containing protein n=2 Tax=Novosphingobium aureum TaxID=2792964 RepID=A0A931MK69_9SPHN|nr:lytic transglycosylase domain-containing protein [Novosphingobium aureum]